MSKKLADFFTAIRAGVAVILAGVGFVVGQGSLPLAAYLMVTSWASDYLDGMLARRRSDYRHSWLGDHDLQIDMSVSVGLLVYLVAAGILAPIAAYVYVAVWILLFTRYGINKALGSAVQAPVYAYFVWAVAELAPQQFWWIATLAAILVVGEWRRFSQHVVPEFLSGLSQTLRQRRSG